MANFPKAKTELASQAATLKDRLLAALIDGAIIICAATILWVADLIIFPESESRFDFKRRWDQPDMQEQLEEAVKDCTIVIGKYELERIYDRNR